MKQSNDELNQFYLQASKWLCRSAFLIIIAVMSHIVSRQTYNFAHWVPHNFLYKIGIPYQAVLWSEQNADFFLHFLGGTILTVLIYGAKFSFFQSKSIAIFVSVSLLCLAAELFQLTIGRGFESSDLLLGILGSFMAYSTFNKKN